MDKNGRQIIDPWEVNIRGELTLYVVAALSTLIGLYLNKDDVDIDNYEEEELIIDYKEATDEQIKEAIESGKLDIEISIVKKSNKFGKSSYGWADLNKITLFNNPNVKYKSDIEECIKIAETIANALNAKGL